VVGTRALLDKSRAFGNLGECYEQLGDFEESVKCHEQYLVIAQNTGSLVDQDKAYRGLGNAHRSVPLAGSSGNISFLFGHPI